MKRLFKWSGAILLLVLVIGGIFIINAFWFRPFSINVFYETAFLKYALRDPELLSSMRLLEQYGYNFHSDDLTDASPAHTQWSNQLTLDNYNMLQTYDRSKLKGQAALSYDILNWYLKNEVDGIKYTWHNFPVNQLFGIQNQLPRFMAKIHHIGSVDDARDYITRLSKFGVKFDQLIESLKLREEKGVIPPRFTVEKVLTEMNGFKGKEAKENVLYTSFQERLEKLQGVDSATRDELLKQVEDEINHTAYPAYGRLIAYFEHLLTKATANNGAWSLPDGDNYYDYLLRSNTTTNMTADEIHELGLAEVERIQGEMDAILREEGYTEGSVAERMTRLNGEERFLYPNTPEGRSELLAKFQAIIDEVTARMPDYFGHLPKSPVKVERVPEFSEKTSASAYYNGPAMDGSRPGIFYANLRNLKEHPKFTLRTLAYHEAVPGHHLQVALQTELTGVPTFRRILGFTAFAEGWALYAERLAWEIGLQDEPFSNLGRLRDELFRGVRLVVDTGIHRKRWSRERAIEYMLANTGMTEHEVVAEIERYFVIPGQATTYKIGMIKILELREKAKAALGDRFDIRAFHDRVIGNGDVPLEILEQQIDQLIAQTTEG